MVDNTAAAAHNTFRAFPAPTALPDTLYVVCVAETNQTYQTPLPIQRNIAGVVIVLLSTLVLQLLSIMNLLICDLIS